MSSVRTFRAGFLFCGLGAGARGFLEAVATLGDRAARFRSVGGIDIDPLACADFERLAGGPAVCADVAALPPTALRAAWGAEAPDCVFLSPPCKGFSRLLGRAQAAGEMYQRLNRLVLQGLWLLCETWPDAPPATIVLENVPGIESRGAALLAQVRDLLSRYGYRLHEGRHDCGEIGGLAQHRRRFLLVARRPQVVPAFIHRPPIQRVRGCGEVLDALPLPLGTAGGPLHALPSISWLTWVRLALIPPGGDWRDLPSVVRASHQRRADPRPSAWRGSLGVIPWDEPTPCVRGAAHVRTGPAAVADPRLGLLDKPHRYHNQYRLLAWDEAANTIIGATRPGSGAATVADPRIAEVVALGRTARTAAAWKGRPGLYGVQAWDEPASTVTAGASVTGSNAVAAVADPRIIEEAGRVGATYRNGTYGVLDWHEAAGAVVGQARVDAGRFAVADPRRSPEVLPVIRSRWDCWHRPLSTLELAALQGLPATLDGGCCPRLRPSVRS